MKLLNGGLYHIIRGIMFLAVVGWIFMGYTSYERSNKEFQQVRSNAAAQQGSFGRERPNPSDPYASRVRSSRERYHDPYARVQDDVVRDETIGEYAGGDWGD